MEEGQIIKIEYGGEKYEVKVIKILELFPNGNGFVRVKFSTGQIRNISIIKKGGKITNAKNEYISELQECRRTRRV